MAAWIAALGLLLVAIAPSLSVAAGLADGGSWSEVCTAQGSKWVRSDAGAPAGRKSGAHPFEHCPCCSIHLPTLGLPPAPPVWLHALDPSAQRPLARPAAPLPRLAWMSAQPRAPPAFS